MLEIVKHPNPALKCRCSPVAIVGDDEKELLRNMARAMYLNHGVGLAAPQIGINRQIAVVDIGDKNVLNLINPEIIEADGTEVMEEGCLSIPEIYIHVKRAQRIKVKSMDENGRETVLEANGLMARVILHEIDHLKGRLIIDHINPIRRFLVLKKK